MDTEESNPKKDPFCGNDRAGLSVPQVLSSIYSGPTGPLLPLPHPHLSLPIPTLLPPRASAHQCSGPHPRAQDLGLASDSCSPGLPFSQAVSARSTSETQWGLNGVYAHNPLMKGREVFLNPARVPDRQLLCDSFCGLPAPSSCQMKARCCWARKPGDQMCVNRVTAWLPLLAWGDTEAFFVSLCTLPLLSPRPGVVPSLQV